MKRQYDYTHPCYVCLEGNSHVIIVPLLSGRRRCPIDLLFGWGVALFTTAWMKRDWRLRGLFKTNLGFNPPAGEEGTSLGRCSNVIRVLHHRCMPDVEDFYDSHLWIAFIVPAYAVLSRN